MSNIYIQEPPCSGKVLLNTTVGDIDIELWAKEAPKACRNFIQLCLEHYYDGTIFHRVVKDFIVQGGDPTGTGRGGESIYGKPFKDEIHSRLRFVRRGLVAMANSGPNDNGSQFFFTMAATPELQNKHTIFGKVGGDTIYNMLRLQEVDVDDDERPSFPIKIKNVKVLSNPYEDIVPRITKKESKENKDDKKKKSKGTKNYKLLSFGEEAEEDEEENIMVSKEMKGKSKSSHDLTDDPKLSSVPAVRQPKRKSKGPDDEDEGLDEPDEDEKERERVKENIKKKLKTESESKVTEKQSDENSQSKKSSRSEELRKEAKQLAKDLKRSKNKPQEEPVVEEPSKAKPGPDNEMVANYFQEKQKYTEMKKKQPKKGSSREAATLALLSSFTEKLHSAKVIAADYDEDDEEEEGQLEEEDEDASDMSWMRHKLKFDTNSRTVIDANVAELDRYEIYDPRNPLTQRRREASKQIMKAKK